MCEGGPSRPPTPLSVTGGRPKQGSWPPLPPPNCASTFPIPANNTACLARRWCWARRPEGTMGGGTRGGLGGGWPRRRPRAPCRCPTNGLAGSWCECSGVVLLGAPRRTAGHRPPVGGCCDGGGGGGHAARCVCGGRSAGGPRGATAAGRHPLCAHRVRGRARRRWGLVGRGGEPVKFGHRGWGGRWGGGGRIAQGTSHLSSSWRLTAAVMLRQM